MMTKSGLRALFAVGAFSFGIAAAVPAGAEAPFGCACLHNDTKVVVKFRYKWGDGQWTSDYLRAGYQETLCWRYTGGSASSPPLGFQIDVDLTNGAAWTTYNLPRGQSQTNKCDAVPRQFHYDISYRPNTNNQFVQMTHRK